MFITKEKKLHFSLICSFYCCLMKGSMALKVAQQFATLRLVAYKPVTYKKISVAQSISDRHFVPLFHHFFVKFRPT